MFEKLVQTLVYRVSSGDSKASMTTKPRVFIHFRKTIKILPKKL